MGLLCSCPLGAALPDIPILECLESVGQIQKVVFQRINASAGTKNVFEPNHATTPTDPAVLASWTPLLAAADGTKVVQSPFIENPEMEAGAARTFGGGNQTLGGIEIIVGAEPTTMNAVLNRVSQDTIRELKKLMCEPVAIFYVDEYGQIIADSNKSDTIATSDEEFEVFGFPVKGMFVGDKMFGGLENPDQNVISWRHSPNWSDRLHVVKPTDFDALNDLVTP